MAQTRQRYAPQEPRFPQWLEATVTPAILLVLTSLYVLSLHLAIDFVGSVDPLQNSDTRDIRYFSAHGLWVLLALLVGIGLGVWFRRSVFAFATLFLVWMLLATVAAQIITFELACRGHNDIIRHWQC